MKIIECRDISKMYFRQKALEQLTFSIEENKITGLIGRNGAGKTTLLKLISGFIKPTAGEIKVFSEQPFNNLFVSANSILVDDSMSFPAALNLGDIMDAAAAFYSNWHQPLAEGLLDYFSLEKYKYHNRLSKGQTSTFNMIIGLASRCPLTLFDEPTIGMDAAVRKDFYRALLKDYLAFPRTIVLSSHHLEEIEHLLEDVLLIKNGQCLLHLPIYDVKEMMISVEGKLAIADQVLQEKEIIYEQSIGTNHVHRVLLREEASVEELQGAERMGLKIRPVNASDACVYLTDKGKGVIDDVFNKN
ncbi:ATP-binding cassette domain-containing protein [Cytobacillus purgationiresistens]|uniref:ABC-2 type transport system ATP-binding protein n=1 Tax=Cytobacillus purgationiresistens TaxID=863449 RepID=A0ABU0AH11_9BACI|nr:ABC transporter ATP-binding protein [Cytobacillus purgationiresistens]MDQ0270551.1 ABC-2 type transport system ATP-binding protein [Cytobacillus purgationiresistens]